MAYCTVDDVRGWLPQKQAIDNQSNNPPSQGLVTQWCADFSGLIDAGLAAVSQTHPATDPDVKSKLKVLLARELAYQVLAVRGAASENKDYAKWHEEFESFMATLTPGAASGVEAILRASSDTYDADSSFPKSMTRNW